MKKIVYIPQDDSAPYGYTTPDREEIKEYIQANSIADIDIYPGADEVGMTMLAAYVQKKFPTIAEKYAIASLSLPWSRMFEIDVFVTEK